MEKVLKLYTFVDGGINDTPFPNSDNPIEIGEFRYDAKRMGGAPTITASVNYPTCLDDMWSEKVYAEFNGEKYYLKQTPTSSRDNEDYRYKHNVELVSERSVLDNVYFFDVVVGDPQENDRPVSNSTKVVFFGDVREFASRLQSSLLYSGLRYTIVVDDDVVSEEKLMSFEDQFFSNVLQDIYNTYKVPYYFEGTTIHIGYSKEGVVIPDIEYGVDNALVSITKNNANVKIVNRVTGRGSSDNIPFYYPNNSPKGDVAAIESDGSQLGVEIIDAELFSDKVELNGVISYQAQEATVTRVTDDIGNTVSSGSSSIVAKFTYKGFSTSYQMRITSYAKGSIPLTISPILNFYKYDNSDDKVGVRATGRTEIRIYRQGLLIAKSDDFVLSKTFDITLPKGSSVLTVIIAFYPDYNSSTNWFEGGVGLSWATDSKEGWYYKEKEVNLEDLGLSISNTAPKSGSTITQELVKYVNTSPNLMPYRYRATSGEERFYNAENRTYTDENGVLYQFNNPYTEGNPKEHIITVEDIKPTIKETVNSMGLRMDMFSEFAYDIDDNDELLPEDDDSDRKFVHSYFFGKLRKLDFNLFDHAIEQQPMTISFTSGNCGACKFTIGVTEEFPQKNPVQVDENGNLVRDENGRVVCGQFAPIQEKDCQPRQQDTINNEVWIALKKEEDTYGILMPKAPKVNSSGEQIESGYRPKPCSDGNNDGDTFVILGISLPESYIINAEKKLEAEILKYMKQNNDEKFTFNINFSRIYFAENEDILKSLSENSKVRIIYNNKSYDLYVSSFSYNISEGDILPDIKVELDETLKVSENAIRNAINEVKSELGKAIDNVDVVSLASPYFLRKDEDDEAIGRINFQKGLTFGNGGKVDMLDGNSAKLTIDYIDVKKKATFTSLEIQEKTHVGGQMLVTPASMSCNNVEELDDCYRCYFQTEGEGGDEIFNQFTVGDQAICQTFNAWESKYYWRLVTCIGENYIDLSKEDCDEYSDAPAVGDKIIQLGNREDPERQNAIVIAAHGDGSPYITQYKGINSYELPSEKIVTKLSSTENIFTGKVHMEIGSDGLEDLQEFVDLQVLTGKANTNATSAQNKATAAIAVADKAQQSADTANENALQAGDAANAANEKAEEAIGKAEAAQDGLDNMKIGGTNLLRNSGFTGDYLSEQLADEKVLEGAAELYSSPLDHWAATNAVVNDSDESSSGKEVSIVNGALSQKLYYKVVKDESYVISFKAKGTSLKLTIGSFTKNIALSTDWEQYEEVFTTTTDAFTFEISNATCSLCEVQLEKGTKRTAWSNSPLDNSSDRAYYQSMKYLSSAIVDGSTDILGGLVLTNQIKVGNYANQEMIEETGGMNGSYTDAESPFLWGGGTLQEAIATIAKHEGGTATPAGEIPFAVTHGGKVILNDAMVRGTVHIGTGSSGLEDFQEWYEKQSQIDSASSNASSAQSMANNAQTLANNAKAAANEAQAAANNAKDVADGAAQRLAIWADDLVISPVEKPALRNELAQINADYNDIIKQLEVYEIENEATEKSTYVTRFNSYRNALNSLINAAEGDTIPDSVTTTQSNYYTARTSVLNAIAKAAKKVADDAQKAADDAVIIANSYQYIANALTNGSTFIDKGLILTSLILLGTMSGSNFANKAGVNGVADNTGNSPAFWAGGTLDQAITTVTKYLQDPTFKPTDAELATMAKAVITHGGRAILNDIILRGTVYATDGEFTGTIESTSGHIGGFQISGNRIGIDQGGTNNGMFLYDSFIGFRENGSSYNSFTLVGENVLPATSGTTGLARFELDGSKDSFNQYTAGYGLIVDVKGYGNPYAFYCTNGVFAGLRYNTKVIQTTDKYTLTKYDHTIVIDVASGTAQIELPKNPEQGQRYEIYTIVDTADLTVYMNGQHQMYNLIDASTFAANGAETYTANKRRHITIFFAGGIWLSDYRYLEKKK